MKRLRSHNPSRGESGNALWIILLAVALLTVLTITISRQSDTAEQSGNVERFRIQASDIMRHSAAVKEAVNTLRLRGISESQIDFTSAGFTNTCLDCLIFGSAGGGLTDRNPSQEWLDATHSTDPGYGTWLYTGANDVTGVGTAASDLVLMISYLRQGLCTQINTVLGITGIPSDGDGFSATAYAGAFPASGSIANVSGRESGCFEDTSGGNRDYTFYQVLIKR